MALFDFLKVSEYKKLIEEQTVKIAGQESTIATQRRTIAQQDVLLCEQRTKLENISTENQKYLQELSTQKDTICNQAKQLAEQQNVLTDDHGKAIEIKRLLARLEMKLARLNGLFLLRELSVKKAEERVQYLKKQAIELEETVLLQDFGLYKPTYNFATSALYKDALKAIRDKQKQMIRDKTAAVCPIKWAVNGSIRKGEKAINDEIKQILLTFNTECENAIDRVKFNNFESMKKRIQGVYDKLNKLNTSLCVTVSQQYLELKFQELTLAYEYAQKKQEEKEYAREQREIQRENARVAKELEEERRRIEKEQAHYQNQMQRLKEQMEEEKSLERKELIANKIEAIKGELADLDKALKDVDYRQANERAGYVYIISNIGSFGENIYKIGMTRRLDPMDRIDELGGASVPFRFDVHALIFSSDAPKLETALHNAFADRRVNMVNGRKEFFHISLEEIEKVVRENHDKTVDFTDLAIAQQYRETLKLIEERRKRNE